MKWKNPLRGALWLLLVWLLPPWAESSATHPLRIFVHYGPNLDSTIGSPTPIQKLVQRVLLPAVTSWLEKVVRIPGSTNSTLHVTRACTNSYFIYKQERYCIDSCAATTTCGPATVPANHLEGCRTCDRRQTSCRTSPTTTAGVSDHDLILYVTAINTTDCQTEAIISHSIHCQLEKGTDRPNVGSLNICPNRVSYLQKDYYWQVQYLVHDLIHVLAFAPQLFSFFRAADGSPLTPRDPRTGLPVRNALGQFAWSTKVIKSGSYHNWEIASGTIARSASFLVTSQVQTAVRDHFACQSLLGAELETQKHSFFHWENRMFQSDSMTGESHRNLVVSKISLAVLSDSGWYSVNYDYAQKLSWGKGLGCRFATSSCLGYMNSQKKTGQPEVPFCRSRPSPSSVTCNVDRTAVARCNMKDYPNALPREFQYFTGTKDFSNHTGGGDEKADYCPYYQAFNVDNQRDSNCYIETNAPDKNVALEVYGASSKCLNHGRQWTQKVGSRMSKLVRNGAGCYKISCETQQLKIFAGDKWYTCTSRGQEILIQVTVNGSVHSGSIICPAFDEVCQGSGCPGDCSHHGRCTASKTCVCDPGYHGSDCGKNNFHKLNDCASQPCQNNGQCAPHSSSDGYTCKCQSGTSGKYCENNVNECASNPCQNGGTCIDDIGQFNCTCATGYKGDHCEQDIKECSSNPCQNGGKCIDKVGGYTCRCSVGYGGLNCELKAKSCGICLHGGTCRQDGSGLCDCKIGYAGVICHIPVDYCKSDPCQNGGTCSMTKTGFMCKCADGFKGVQCETPIIKCSASPCQNDGTCTDMPLGFQCKCPFGFNGERCENNIDECLSSPCRNNATCVDLIGDFYCDCRSGYTGKLCEINTDECDSTPCQNQGICHDQVNGYYCECQLGFEGTHCERDVDECAAVGGVACLNGGTCVDALASFQCTCAAGYTGGRCETNVDECASSPCQNNGTCVEEISSGYRCVCPTGYAGVQCEMDVNECASNPCRNGATCVNLLGKFTCSCSTGFTGSRCDINVDDCEAHDCQNGATCVDGIASYTCDCAPSYVGLKCESKANPCTSTPCRNGGTCVSPSAGHFLCYCSSDFSGLLCESEIDSCASNPCPSGSQCIDHQFGYSCDDCVSSPCQNGGQCVDTLRGFDCQCPPGFAGVRCSIDLNECDSEPCQNGGTCVDGANGFTCVCARGYVGLLCERDADECASLPCMNNGLCLDQVNGFECQCRYGYNGERCEWPPGDCRASACANGGNCTAMLNGSYVCVCPDGYSGTRCDVADDGVDACVSSPCLNNGTCTDQTTSYKCACCKGFTGANCGINIDDCVSSPCQNGALCVDGVNGYSCICPRRYVGSHCTEPYDSCAGSPCQNNGTCVPTPAGKSSTCDCPPGYAGKRCQFKLSLNCVDVTCNNGGLCIERRNGRAKCRCLPGYTGERCETVDNPCVFGPCLNGGKCVRNDDFAVGYECQCESPFGGNRCEIVQSACHPNPCQNNGACLEDEGAAGFVCMCAFGYEGSRCESPASACDSQPCRNGGGCRLTASGGFKCACVYPFAGETCADVISAPSFKKRSFLSLRPLLDGAGTFSLSFSFNPRTSNGVLILTSQKRSGAGNYFALTLADRSVKLVYNFGGGKQELTSREKVSLEKWHSVNVRCESDFRELAVDSQTPVQENSTLLGKNFQLSRRIFIGYKGEKEFAVRGFQRSFTGCLSDLALNSYAVSLNASTVLQSNAIKNCDCDDECDSSDSCFNGGTCIHRPASHGGSVCACPRGYTGPTCDKSSLFSKPRFSGSSYLAVPTPEVSGNTLSLYFAVRLSGPDGVLLHMSEFDDGTGEFVVVYLREGHVVFGFNSGSGAAWLQSEMSLKIGQVYFITARKEGQKGSLEINNLPVATGNSKGPFESISLRNIVYVGGVPSTRSLPDGVSDQSGFVGCLWSLGVNYNLLDLSSSNLHALAVGVGSCSADESAGLAPCSGQHQAASSCVRNLNFGVPSFNGASYLEYAHLSRSSRHNRWSMNFRVTTQNGMVFYAGQVGNATEEYVYVKIVNSILQLRVRLGGGREGLIASNSMISLGSWHALAITRNDNAMVMVVDRQKFNGSAPGETTTMSTDLKIFLGGLPQNGPRASTGPSMVGCIRSVQLDDVAIVLRDRAIGGQNIQECRA